MPNSERRTHALPHATDNNASFAAPHHSPHAIITESYIASLFTEHYGHCIRLDAFDNGTPFLQLACAIIYNAPSPYTVRQGCYRLPNSYVLGSIRELITELCAGDDTFTRVRVNSSKFIFGVLSLLLGTTRIPKLHHPSPDDFDAKRAEEILSLPSTEPERYDFVFEPADEHWNRMHPRKYG